VFSTLGPDLRKSDRRSEAARRAGPAELTSDFTQPLGLRNLGATCYLNALMQCLFHNKPFRSCVYNTDTKPWTDANMAGVMLELQKAFAHMQWGYKNVYDLTYFTKRLGLQTQEQQDPQEFNKLFLSKLEEMVKGTAAGKRKRDPGAGPVCVTDVFRGQQKYVTRCLECFNESGTDTPFYELELPVEGSSSLQQSLEMYLAAESLTGENQFACSHCGHKTDAERAAVISEAPEVLLLQLMRYVYDRTTWTKKKLKVTTTR
jgi:ubiquitin carboxyl-terminal hydrolase 48